MSKRKPDPELEPRGYFTSDRSKSGGRYASPDLVSAPDLELPEPEAVTNRQDILLAAGVGVGAGTHFPGARVTAETVQNFHGSAPLVLRHSLGWENKY